MEESTELQVNTQALAEALASGVQTSEQAIHINRLVKTVLSLDLVQNQRSLIGSIQPVLELQARVKEKIIAMLDAEIDGMDLETAWKYFEKMTSLTMSILDLQRKIVQGKELFNPADNLASEERSMLQLLQSFKTPEEKQMFLKLLKEAQEHAKSMKASSEAESIGQESEEKKSSEEFD